MKETSSRRGRVLDRSRGQRPPAEGPRRQGIGIHGKVKEASDSEDRLAMLRNYLAENGLAPDTNDLTFKAGDVSSRVVQLENKLT